MGNGLVDLSAAGQAWPRLLWPRVVGLDFQGLTEMGDSLIDLSASGQSEAEVEVGRRVAGSICNAFW